MATHHLFEIEYPPGVKQVLETMRSRLTKEMGVTIAGNRVTVRFTERGYRRQVHMVILEVDDGMEPNDEG
jgi:hypothetical protein